MEGPSPQEAAGLAFVNQLALRRQKHKEKPAYAPMRPSVFVDPRTNPSLHSGPESGPDFGVQVREADKAWRKTPQTTDYSGVFQRTERFEAGVSQLERLRGARGYAHHRYDSPEPERKGTRGKLHTQPMWNKDRIPESLKV